MRRRTILGLVAVTGCVAAARGARSRRSARQASAAAEAPVEIAPGVFLIGPHGRSQTCAYLLREGPAWVLVDSGWAGDAARIRAAVGRLLGPTTVPAAILLTHVHPDHAGSARELAEAWACPIRVHPDELAIARGDFGAMVAAAGPLDRWVVLPLMRVIGRQRREAILERGSLGGLVGPLGEAGAIPGFREWRWLHTPGHTPGHVAYVRSRDRVAVTGDAVVTLAVNSPAGMLAGRQAISGPPWYTTWDPAAAARSIAALAELEPAVLASGHGRTLAGPATAAAVRAFAARR